VTHGEPVNHASSSSSSAGNGITAADAGHTDSGQPGVAAAALEQAGHAQQSAQGPAAGQVVEAAVDRELLAAGAQKR
jgi:hypothetical protein